MRRDYSATLPYRSFAFTMSKLGCLRPGSDAALHMSRIECNEGEQRIFLICIRFGSCEVRRLNLALMTLREKTGCKQTKSYQKCLIFCSKILLNVFHNLSLTVLLPWQQTGIQTSPILKTFLAIFGVLFSYLKWCIINMIQRAYKYVSLSLWPCLTFLELKITYILKSSGWGLKKE